MSGSDATEGELDGEGNYWSADGGPRLTAKEACCVCGGGGDIDHHYTTTYNCVDLPGWTWGSWTCEEFDPQEYPDRCGDVCSFIYYFFVLYFCICSFICVHCLFS